MKQTVLLTLLAPAILFNILSCSHTLNHFIHTAEGIIDSQPEYALTILNGMDISVLSNSEYAKWCLLTTQAQDRISGYHKTDSIIRIAVTYYEHHKSNPELLVRSYYYMGRVSQELQNAPLAQEYYLKAMNIGELINDTTQLSLICNQLGMLYTYQYAYNDALFFMQKALDYLKLSGDTVSQSYVLRNIARTYGQIDSLDQSILYFEQALKYSNSSNRTSILCELGDRFTKKKDYDKALIYLNEALKLADQEDYPAVCLNLGRVYVETEKSDLAKSYLLKSLDSSVRQPPLASYAYLAKLSKNSSNYGDYMKYQTEYEALRDSMTAYINTQTMMQMQALYNYQQAQKKASKSEHEKNIVIRNGLIIIIIILIVSGALTIYYIRISTKQKKIVKDQEAVFVNYQKAHVEESYGQIDNNLKIISILKGDHLKKAKEKEAVLYEIRLLELENIWILKRMEEREKMENEFRKSDLFNLLQNEKKFEKITNRDLDELLRAIDGIYPTFRFKVVNSFKELSIEDMYVIYLLKARIKKSHVADIVHLSRQAINNRCKRLAEDSFGIGSSQKVLEQFLKYL